MPQANMIVHVDFPNWENLTDPVKSLINFFMKDASLMFRGEYDGSSLDYMSANVRSKERLVVDYNNDTDYFSLKECMELNIAYNSTQPYPVEAVDSLPDVHSTLVAQNSLLKFVKYDKETNIVAKIFAAGIEPIDSIVAELTPKIGETTNTDPSFTPDGISSGIVKANISTTNLTFYSDYQLRTSSFYIDDGNGNIDLDAFYKIGIVPLNKKYPCDYTSSAVNESQTVEGLKTALKSENFIISTTDGYVSSFAYHVADLGFNCCTVEEYNDYSSSFPGKVFLSAIFPLVVNGYIIGILYARMYNQDGEPVTVEDLEGYTPKFYIRPSESGEPVEVAYGYQEDLIITDQDLDGGYIQSPAPTST